MLGGGDGGEGGDGGGGYSNQPFGEYSQPGFLLIFNLVVKLPNFPKNSKIFTICTTINITGMGLAPWLDTKHSVSNSDPGSLYYSK